MSDVADQSFKPTQVSAANRSIQPIVWLAVALVAAGALAATIAYSGGVGEALKLVGLGSLVGGSSQSLPSEPSVKPSGSAPAAGATTDTASVTASASADANADATADAAASATPAKPPTGTSKSAAAVVAAPGAGLPSYARTVMYREQLQSQKSIVGLVDNKIASLKLGTPNVLASSATVPVTATYRNGSSVNGTMTLRKYNGLWYFFSLTASGGGSALNPAAIDPSVVSVITRQQATSANQDMIVKGILGGGFKTATVVGVSKGSGTATVNVNLTGGTSRPKKGQFVSISKRDGASTYWFIARFTAR